ncbi:hypothetical protein AHAS_Ahas18G0176200 [Arachis hypogaea]
MKNLQIARKSVVARNLQLQEFGVVASPSKSDSGAVVCVKITLDFGPQLILSSSEQQANHPPKQANHPPPSNPDPTSKKHKTSSSGIYEQGFDAMAWSEKHIIPHSFISKDDVSIDSHLQVMARGGVRTDGLCVALLKELKKTPSIPVPMFQKLPKMVIWI